MEKDNSSILKQEKCNIGNIVLRKDKILTFTPFDGVTTCNLKDLEEMYSIFMDMTGGFPHLYYSDNTNLKNLGSEERVYVSSNFHHFALACAVKENSAIIRFVTHSMVYLNKPKIPIKMFKTEEDSFKWLKSL
jgi:hypothetical protein